MDTSNDKSLQVLKLRPSLKKWLMIEVFFLALGGIGIAMLIDGATKGWFVAPVGVLAALTTPFLFLTAGLEIGPEGFTTYVLKNATFTKWSDVQDFGVITIGLNKMVGYNYLPHYVGHEKTRAASVKLSGVEAALPDTYGMKPQQLADLMNKYRREV